MVKNLRSLLARFKLTWRIVVLFGMLALALVGFYTWQDSRQYGQCKEFLRADGAESIGLFAERQQVVKRLIFCLERVYGVKLLTGTSSEVGKRIKEKFPAYSDLSDEELGKRVLEKYK